ncbi:hypothetical protein [Streptomyces capitiformicae]|uniref:hypothetical protein n=1 Tax=Streptomyces capitiformicae TaxID=2014920 RepID=UPI001674709D|nr:hypothetical protein [Streptomyces capitiformicae]
MTAPGALAPPTRASHGVVRWAHAAVITLLTALAVLIHHESAAVAIGPPSSPAAHVMTPGMVMSGTHAAPATAMSGHGHGSATAQTSKPTAATVPTMIPADGPACDGMAMQHCSTASLQVVKLAPPTQSLAPQDLAAHEVVPSGARAAGTVGRAPPDLSVLSQLRI